MGVNARLVRAFAVFVAVVTAFTLAVPLGGILGIIGGVQADPPETVLRIGFMQRIDSLNPYIGVNDASYIFYGLVYDAMNVIDNQMQPTSDLAMGVWAVPTSDPAMIASGEPYGSVWQYNLTDQAYWHDGEPFTADDVVFSFNLNAHNFASMWAYQPYSYYMKDAEKIDEQTVRVHFYDRSTGDPMPAAYAYLMSIPMLPKHKLESMDPFTIGYNWTGLFPSENPPLVGTGPFMATSQLYHEWLAGDQITLVKNPNYHWKYTKAGAPEIKFDKLVMYFYDEATAMVYALENKQLDVASFSPYAYEAIKSDIASGAAKNITTYEGPKITQYWTEISINANLAGPNPSRLDHNIRSAMAMATNKSYIVSQYYLGLADEGTTMIPPVNTYWHYEPNATEKIPFDLEAARNLLEINGYRDTNGDGIRECTAGSYAVTHNLVPANKPLVYDMIIRREYPEEKNIAMYLQDVWAQIGIKLNYRIVDEIQLSIEAYGYAYDTLIWYWSSDIDPNYQLYVQTKAAWGGWNDNRWTNATYEQNYTKSVTELNKTQRKVYVDNCQRANYLDEHYIILAYPYQTYAWRNDTFSGWGDWAADPGRSMDNFWMGNPLFFDLVPLYGGSVNTAPRIDSLSVNPNPVLPNSSAELVFVATDYDGDALTFYVEFGDGSSAVAHGANTTSPQAVNFGHSYELEGLYDVTVWVNDSYEFEDHNVSRAYQDRVLVGSGDSLVAAVEPDPVVIGVRERLMLAVNLTWLGQELSVPGVTRYVWYVDPWNAGSFDYRARQQVNFTAGSSPTTGTIRCAVTHYEVSEEVTAPLTINPPTLGSVKVVPSSVLMECGSSKAFSTYASDTIGFPMENLTFAWSVEGLAPADYSLNASVGPSVVFSGFVEGTVWLNATVTVGAVTRTGSSIISLVWSLPPRSVSYNWYDMFNVPFGEWWYARYDFYTTDNPITNTYPYIFEHHGPYPGDISYYSNMRLNITGRNMADLNMNERPEFLPLFGVPRGGNVDIDWHMNYLTDSELTRYPGFQPSWNDGWLVCLNGTVTLDKDAAMAVMNLSEAGFEDFSMWWTVNKDNFRSAYGDWLQYEGNVRLDIYPAYDGPFQILCLGLSAAKVGDDIVITYDVVSWGMEVLMTRWMHDAFMPTEWYFEGMDFHANISSDMASIDIQTAVDYAIFADETRLVPGGSTSGEPCWVWEAMLQDYVPSNIYRPCSAFDAYKDKTYLNHAPGSTLYGIMAPYDYTPGCWNLSEGEILTISWPAGNVQFKRHVGPGSVANETGEMMLTSSQPSEADLPGVVSIDVASKTITFTGPADLWSWSMDQTAHQYLASEWDRLGVQPHGVPYLEFKMAINTPPMANAFSPSVGDMSTLFEFNASQSYDLEEDLATLQVRWDWDNDGTWDTNWSADKVAYHQFGSPGTYLVKLEVKDSNNATNITYVSVEVVTAIPEFNVLIVPALCLMLVVAVIVRSKRRRGSPSS